MFVGIQPETLGFLLEIAAVRDVARGEYFYREGDQAESMFLLESGRVLIMKAWNHQDYVLMALEPGDCFGEAELVECNGRNTSAYATSACKAMEVSAGDLYCLYKTNPEQFRLIYANMGRETCRRLREADSRFLAAKPHSNACASSDPALLRGTDGGLVVSTHCPRNLE